MKWPVTTLGEICHVQSGGTPSRARADYWDGAIPWVTITDMRRGLIDSTVERISQAGLETSAAKILPPGTLLLSIFATIGRTALLKIPAATNQAIAGITVRPDQSVDVGYLRHYLDHHAGELASRGRGVAQNNINLSILKSSPVPLPPLPEQRRIAAILDKADALRAKRREAIAKLDQLLQSVFLDMFGDPVTNPKGWRAERCDSFFDFSNGLNFSAEERGRGLLVLDVKNMYGPGIAVNCSQLYRVDKKIKPDILLTPGDILFVRSSVKESGVGWPAIFTGYHEPVSFCGFIIRGRPTRQDIFDEHYLVHALRQPGLRSQMISSAGKVALTNISQANLGRLLVPLPPIELQRKFGAVCATLSARSVEMSRSVQALEELFRSSQQLVFSGGI